MPGTTHAAARAAGDPRAPPVAHAWALSRDLERIERWAERASICRSAPARSRRRRSGWTPTTARRLGFDRPFANSIDAVSDRDVVQEFLAVAAIFATHVVPAGRRPGAMDGRGARLGRAGRGVLDGVEHDAAEAEPGQRRARPRRRPARIAGTSPLAAVLQGLPLGYHRDLQEDKEPAFDAADTLALVLPALEGAVGRSASTRRRCARRARPWGSTRRTSPRRSFARACRSARPIDGRGSCFKRLGAEGRSLARSLREEWDGFGLPDGAGLLDPDRAVRARGGRGGPSAAVARADRRVQRSSTIDRA